MILGEHTKDRTRVRIMREPSDSGDHPETTGVSMITMIASMYLVARKLARNFSTGVPYPRPLADHPTQFRQNFQPKGDPRERWCINNRGNPFFSHVICGEEIAHKEPGPPAQTGVRSS